jgi:hypothetical protein
MKKLILIFLSVAFSINVWADKNPFRKLTTSIDKVKGQSKYNFKYVRKTAGTINVPTLTKESIWDPFSSIWYPNTSTKHVYINDLLTADYIFDYTQSDTLSRKFYTYNANKQLIEVVEQDKIGTGVYSNTNRYTYTYANNNLLVIEVLERWDEFTQSLIFENRITREVDNRGNEIAWLVENYQNGNWEVDFGFKSIITYLNNTDLKYTSRIDSAYFSQTNKFEIDFAELIKYDSNNNIETIKYYSVPALSDTLQLRSIDSVYYSNNVPILYVSYNNFNNILKKEYKVDNIIWHNYNSNLSLFDNIPETSTESTWNGSTWNLFGRGINTFPDNYGSIIGIEETYIINNFVPNKRFKELYDFSFRNTELSEEIYNSNLSSWELNYGSKRTLQYDGSTNVILETYYSVDQASNLWLEEIMFEYSNYITISTGINHASQPLVATLYPNPSMDGHVSINVNMEAASVLTIKITDLKGSVVYTDKKELGKGLNTVELSNLQQGLYLVELSTEFGVARTKLAVN